MGNRGLHVRDTAIIITTGMFVKGTGRLSGFFIGKPGADDNQRSFFNPDGRLVGVEFIARAERIAVRQVVFSQGVCHA